MRLEPPAQLVALLERLGLAGAEDVARVAKEVTRLARELPPFDALWIDALARARVLTPYQAAELHAGRGEALRVGPYLLCGPIGKTCDYATFRASRAETHESARLAVARLDALPGAPDAAAERLAALVAKGQRWHKEHSWPTPDTAAVVTAAGVDAGRLWAAAPWAEGRSIAEQLARCGRFPPAIVEAIARPLLAKLAELEHAELAHGRLAADAVLLNDQGGVVILSPGLRAALHGGQSFNDRRDAGRLLWQMLCGREPPEDAVVDPRRFAPQTSAALAEVVLRLLEATNDLWEANPFADSDRQRSCLLQSAKGFTSHSQSLNSLAERLLRPNQDSRRATVRFLSQRRRPSENWYASFLVYRRPVIELGPWLKPAGALAAVALMLTVVWLSARWLHAPRSTGETAQAPAAKEAATPSQSTFPTAGKPSETALRETPEAPVARHAASPPLVKQTAYVEPAKPPVAKRPLDLVLDAGRTIDATKLKFLPGQRIRGLSRQRPALAVPADGLVIGVEDVCFENVDFVAAKEAKTAAPLVRVEAARVEFCGCTFTGSRSLPLGPAIAWVLPQPGNAFAALPTGRIILVDCTFGQVEAAIACQGRGARACEAANVLHTGRGPLVRLVESPRQDEPFRLTLSRLTLRESGPLVACGGDDGMPQLAVVADACVFAPREGEPLVSLIGRRAPKALVGLTWSGQSSLLATDTPFASWCGGLGEAEPLDDSAIAVAGLVRSKIEFAGKAGDGPAASRAVHWLAPLPTAEPPGIDPRRLAPPQSMER